MILVSKFMVHRALSDKTYLSLGLLSPLKLQDQYKQSWSASINDSSKCLNYRIFKTEHEFENYLIRMSPKMRKTLIDYRLCKNKLPIETGRWANIDRNLRKCKLCNSGTVGDEFHYVMECCFFSLNIFYFNLVRYTYKYIQVT